MAFMIFIVSVAVPFGPFFAGGNVVDVANFPEGASTFAAVESLVFSWSPHYLDELHPMPRHISKLSVPFVSDLMHSVQTASHPFILFSFTSSINFLQHVLE